MAPAGARPQGRHRPSRAAIAAAWLLAAIAFLLAPAGAAGGTYTVRACDAAPETPHTAWREREDRGMAAASLCPTRGDPDRGLRVRNRVNAGVVRRGNAASHTFRAPAGASLRGIEVDWRGRRTHGDWLLGLVRGDGRLLAGCRPTSHGSGACRLQSPKGAPVRRTLRGSRLVRIQASCGARRGCPTGARRRRGDRTRVRLAVHAAWVTVADGSAPNLRVGGSLLDGGWQRGRVAASLNARDNVGIRGTALRLDGRMHDSDAQRCDFTRAVPCPRGVRTDVALDTRDVSDGRHTLALSAGDAAGNRRLVERSIRVDNHAPAPVRDVRVVGGSGLRSTNSFDLRWTPPPGQASPIVAAHYRLCRAGGSGGCVSGTRAGAVDGIDGLRVPSRGHWRFQVWLEDEAGNASPASASAPVVLRYDDRSPARLTAGIADGRGGSRERAKVDFGDRAVVTGSLSGPGGERMGGAPVEVRTRVRGSDRWRRVGTASTGSAGRYRLRLPAGPSRAVGVEFAGDRRLRPASSTARLAVRAKSSISVSRRRVENGDRVRFRGRLLGGHVPREGKLVQLEAFYRERWRTFAVVRSSPRGRWRYRYRFEATRGRVRYPFRAWVPRERGYPYALGRSGVVSVVVNGR